MGMINTSNLSSHAKYDALIAGAGPAGCSAAMALCDEFRVLLVDSSSFPRNKTCGGILVESSWQHLENAGLSIPKHVFSDPGIISSRITDVDNSFSFDVERKFYNVNRAEFDHWLLSSCKEKVEFMPSTSLHITQKTSDGFVSVLQGAAPFKVHTANVIDSTGSSSFSRNIRGMRIPFYIAYQELIKCNYTDKFELILCNDITDYYIWAIPKGKYTLFGTAFPQGSAKNGVRLFRNFIRKSVPGAGRPEKIEGGLLVRPSVEDILLSRDGVLLAGESAVSFALRSGSLCAESILTSAETESFYAYKCRPLIDEICEKSKVSDICKDPDKRVNVLKRAFSKSIK